MLAEQFRGSYSVAMLANGRLSSRRALLQAILFELCLPYRGMEEGELRLSLIDHLAPNPNCPNGMLLLVDEAHCLPLRLLEELRMITNLVRNGQPRVRLVLAGSAALEERFASPKLESFSQRITARCYLESFDRDETLAYVQAQITAVGGNPEAIFTDDALVAIHRATDGVPRLVSQVCDHALVLAYAGGNHQLDAAGIEEAWADLQQLPTPWNESARADDSQQEDGVIEFGGLDAPSDGPAEAADAPCQAAATEQVVETQQDEGPEQETEPTERLNQITEHLESLEAEFEPVGTIGPEAQLAFPHRVDPFAEHFAEEEVVVDRYGSLDSPATQPCAAVHSAEGRVLSAMLEPYQHAADDASLSWHDEAAGLRESDTHSQQPDGPSVPLAEDPVLPNEPWSISVAEPIEPAEAPAPACQPDETEEGDSADAQPSWQPRPESNVAEDPSDEDIMIVEDEPQVARVDPSTQAPLVRRQEYRQLFAKLRRG
jgi:hypothetical protein